MTYDEIWRAPRARVPRAPRDVWIHHACWHHLHDFKKWPRFLFCGFDENHLKERMYQAPVLLLVALRTTFMDIDILYSMCRIPTLAYIHPYPRISALQCSFVFPHLHVLPSFALHPSFCFVLVAEDCQDCCEIDFRFQLAPQEQSPYSQSIRVYQSHSCRADWHTGTSTAYTQTVFLHVSSSGPRGVPQQARPF